VSRVLVIGATGLLGGSVAAALESGGHQVHRASRNQVLGPQARAVDLADLIETTDRIAEIEPDVVVQMTGGVGSDPTHLAEINLIPTINLIRAVAVSAPSAAVFVSGSAAEYGTGTDGPISEESPLLPVSPYGWVKLVETSTARELARLDGLNMTVVRPFNPVTPGLPRSTALGNFRAQLLEAEGPTRRVVCGRVDIVRDYVTGRFIGEAVAALVKNPPGGVVNICSGVGIRLDEVMFSAARLLDVELVLDQDEELASLPAPASVIGDPTHLYSLVEARADSTADRLAVELLGVPPDPSSEESSIDRSVRSRNPLKRSDQNAPSG
jgi:GDP-4-dehydro-6-deoxy-D-mannose reductase